MQPSPDCEPSAAPRPTVVLCLTGSIAAFKAAEVARHLLKAGAHVVPVMSAAACHFLGPSTLHALCGEPVRTDMFDPSVAGESHVALAQRADVVAFVPATADLIEAMANGRANDLVRAVALCARSPLVVAPAMHPRMWAHPATQRNVARLMADGRVRFVGPVEGEVASGEVGVGRMADPEAVATAILATLRPRGSLAGRRLVVTAGPTVEELDPVRLLTNRSSGTMGFAIAGRAAARGARVTLVAGPVALATPPAVQRVDVRSALELKRAVWQALGDGLDQADALVMAAAVADFRPAERRATKLERDAAGPRLVLELEPNPDVLAEIGAARQGRSPLLVGFALETGTDEAMLARAQRKLERKRVDLIVANQAAEALEGGRTRIGLVRAGGATMLEAMSKQEAADRVLDAMGEAWQRADGGLGGGQP